MTEHQSCLSSSKLHRKFHDLYGYIGFLIRVPFHIFHEQEIEGLFGLNGASICKCGYFYDRGYYTIDCRKCYT